MTSFFTALGLAGLAIPATTFFKAPPNIFLIHSLSEVTSSPFDPGTLRGCSQTSLPQYHSVVTCTLDNASFDLSTAHRTRCEIPKLTFVAYMNSATDFHHITMHGNTSLTYPVTSGAPSIVKGSISLTYSKNQVPLFEGTLSGGFLTMEVALDASQLQFP